MWTISNWPVPGALRRACDPQLAPSRRGDRVSVRGCLSPSFRNSHALSWWLTTVKGLTQRRDREALRCGAVVNYSATCYLLLSCLRLHTGRLHTLQ
jgi:hypothetical protein